MKKAVCLLSGGLDSTTVLAIALSEKWNITALTINYGQLHRREIESARRIAFHYKISKHHFQDFSLPWKGSSLVDSDLSLPENRSESEMTLEIPNSYVPARNTIFLSLAASCAEAEGAQVIFIGANAIDYSGYPDCRPEYLSQFERTLELGTKCGVEGKRIKIEAPLLKMSKADIIKKGTILKAPYELTWSCYKGGVTPCGVCDSCALRSKGFYDAGIEDPAYLKQGKF